MFVETLEKMAGQLQHDSIFGITDDKNFTDIILKKDVRTKVSDGSHPTKLGHQYMFEWLVDHIEAHGLLK